MKKSLLALAVLGAFASAASAQSSVTLSGGIDAAIQRTNGAWNMSTGNSGRSNFTLSGTEDLGGGTSAFFALNHRFNVATGQSTSQPENNRFYRQGWVGLNGSFGNVRLGRLLPVLQDWDGNYDPFGTETIGSTHTGGINAGLAGSSRVNNAIYYKSPKLGGLEVHANIAAADQNGATASTAGSTLANGIERPLGFGVMYAAGPVNVAAAYDRNARNEKTNGLYGSYDFGAAKLMAQYEKGDNFATPANPSWKRSSIGMRAPMGAATLKAGYLKQSNENKKKFAAGMDYNLSKRTIVYSDVAKTSGTGFTATQNKAQFDFGIWHKF